MTVRSVRQALVGAALTVTTLDLLQVLLLDWRPKHVGALAGAAVYLLFAWGIHGDRRWAGILVAAMPVIPLSVLALSAAGASLPVAPDAAMITILGVQLLAAVLAIVWLRMPAGE
jgi:hypothetical protein